MSGIDRNTLFQGPGHIVYNGKAILAADDIKVVLKPDLENVGANGYGVIGRRRKDMKIEVTCTPLHWDNLPTLLPYAALQIGESAFGPVDLPLQIIPRNGANSGITLANAAVTKMPTVYYSATKKPLGAMTFTGLLANATDPAAEGAYYTLGDVAALPPPNLAKIRNGIYTIDWGSGTGSIVGMGSSDGFELDTDLQLVPKVADGFGTIDMWLAGLVASVKFTPLNASWASVLAAHTGAIGADMVAKDLLIKTMVAGVSTTVATIPNCHLLQSEGVWGDTQSRLGAFEFKSVRKDDGAGGLAPLWTLAP